MAYTTIDNPELYFQTKLYTGNASTNAITLDGSENMQPDWVWLKNRSSAYHHRLFDSVRGATKNLASNRTDAESTESGLTSFNSDGFTLGSDGGANNNTDSYVAWNWKASGSTASNTDGTETTNVSANTTAGFSIITYSGTTAVDTYGHGLSQKPEMMIFKTRAGASRNWVVYHKDIGATKHLHLNTTDAENTYQFMFNNTEPTNSVITLSDDGEVNKSGSTYVGYIFHGVKGFSKIGSYTGNGNADGTFVYTGFKPAFVIRKVTSASSDWLMQDNKRSESGGFNQIRNYLFPNSSQAEVSNQDYFNIDFLSNGFKMRSTDGGANGSGSSYIYMAFAENPFVTSSGVPACAR